MEMKDKLEKFVEQNRQEFDSYEPPVHAWESIESKLSLNPKKKYSFLKISARIAAVVAISLASYFAHDLIDYVKTDEFSAVEKILDYTKSPDLIEAESYYSGLIDNKMAEIKLVAEKDPELQQEVNFEMKELDDVFEELKHDLNDNIENEEIVSAMIQNYRLKLEVLEDILTHVKQANSESTKKESNERFEI